MFDMRSEINKLCTNLYQTSISTNGAKIILKKHGPKQQDSCMQMKKNETCEFEIVNDSHSLSYLQTNHDLSSRRKFATNPSADRHKYTCCEFRLRKQNAGLRD